MCFNDTLRVLYMMSNATHKTHLKRFNFYEFENTEECVSFSVLLTVLETQHLLQ